VLVKATTTTMAASLAASCAGVCRRAYQAGLNRQKGSHSRRINRRVVSRRLTCTSSTLRARDNLLRRASPGDILVTGNTIMDMVQIAGNLAEQPLPGYFSEHRRKRLPGQPSARMGTASRVHCQAIREVALRYERRRGLAASSSPKCRETVQRMLESLETSMNAEITCGLTAKHWRSPDPNYLVAFGLVVISTHSRLNWPDAEGRLVFYVAICQSLSLGLVLLDFVPLAAPFWTSKASRLISAGSNPGRNPLGCQRI
jgi:hypothetical protein